MGAASDKSNLSSGEIFGEQRLFLCWNRLFAYRVKGAIKKQDPDHTIALRSAALGLYDSIEENMFRVQTPYRAYVSLRL